VTYDRNADVAPENTAEVVDHIADGGLELGVVSDAVGGGNRDADIAPQHAAQESTGDGLESAINNWYVD
jgi:hypothetical protein